MTPTRKYMFEVLTADNSQHITLNDNAGIAPTRALIIAKGSAAIGWSVWLYAKRHSISAARVGFAVRPVRNGEV